MKFQLKVPRVTTPQEHVVSSRGTAYLWDQILRVTEKSTNSGCYSVEHASGNCGPEGSGGLSETLASDEEWWSDEVDLNTVTIGNMSVDS